MKTRSVSYPRVLQAEPSYESPERRHVNAAMKTILLRAYQSRELIYSVTHHDVSSIFIGKHCYDNGSERHIFNKALAALVRYSYVDLVSGAESCVTAFTLSAKGAMRVSVMLNG